MKVPQIYNENHNFISIIGTFYTNYFYPLNCGSGMRGIYLFHFASCKPIRRQRMLHYSLYNISLIKAEKCITVALIKIPVSILLNNYDSSQLQRAQIVVTLDFKDEKKKNKQTKNNNIISVRRITKNEFCTQEKFEPFAALRRGKRWS